MSVKDNREFVWDVLLAEDRRSVLGAKKPTGTLVINHGQGDAERIILPMAVSRILAAKAKSGEIRPETREELLHMVDELSRSCARTRIQRLIDRREYSSNEIVEKLRLDGYQQATIDGCLARACEVGLVSDLRYADAFIRSKVSAGWGQARIVVELNRRGIEAEDVPGWPYEYLDPDDELSRAMELAGRRRVSGPRAFEKLVRFLCNRGFSLGVAKRAAQRVLEEDAE